MTKRSNFLDHKFEAFVKNTTQHVAFTGTSAQSAAFGDATEMIYVFVTQDAFCQIGSNPTATTSAPSSPLFAGIWHDFQVRPGQKIAIIRSVASGTAYIEEGLVE